MRYKFVEWTKRKDFHVSEIYHLRKFKYQGTDHWGGSVITTVSPNLRNQHVTGKVWSGENWANNQTDWVLVSFQPMLPASGFCRLILYVNKENESPMISSLRSQNPFFIFNRTTLISRPHEEALGWHFTCVSQWLPSHLFNRRSIFQHTVKIWICKTVTAKREACDSLLRRHPSPAAS